jgi:hypothetical protein
LHLDDFPMTDPANVPGFLLPTGVSLLLASYVSKPQLQRGKLFAGTTQVADNGQ